MHEYRVDPGTRIELKDFDPDDTHLVDGGKSAGREKNAEMQGKLDELQEVLFAAKKEKVLIVLQGMDTSGKDGAIRHVAGAFDPQGVRVVSFGKPTEEELAHDYLWRVHRHVPAKGEIVLFNRSHYEDVLVVRVHDLAPKSVWSKRFDQINAFEKMLAESGTTILKFFLHISNEEQRERLQARVDDPTKRWKFQHGDLDVRKHWDEYRRAYEDVLSKTSTKWAPWHIVPANKKWYRDFVVGSVVIDALEKLDMKYPEVDLSKVVIE